MYTNAPELMLSVGQTDSSSACHGKSISHNELPQFISNKKVYFSLERIYSHCIYNLFRSTRLLRCDQTLNLKRDLYSPSFYAISKRVTKVNGMLSTFRACY